MNQSPSYSSWRGMHQRCTNINAPKFKYYGGRGIAVCSEWNEFKNFQADMGDRPAGLTLDRIDNNLGYSKGNCRWGTGEQQNNNKRSRAEVQNTATTCTAKPRPRRPGHPKWPWATMKVGEFFFVERDRNTMTALAWASGKRLGRKFSTRMCYAIPYSNKHMLSTPSDKRACYGIGVWRES